MARTTLGELEELILLALLHLGGESYAVPIVAELEDRSGRSVSPVAAHVVMRRLEARGFLASRLGEPDAARGGRPPRLFRISPSAMPLLRASRRARTSLWAGLEATLEEPS